MVQKEATEERRKRIELQELVGTRDEEVINQGSDRLTQFPCIADIISLLCRWYMLIVDRISFDKPSNHVDLGSKNSSTITCHHK